MKLLEELIKKIELQSILVLAITLVVGLLLLNKDNSLNTPAGILGSFSIAAGLLYTLASFYSNQVKENYSHLISEYKTMISSLKTSQKHIEKSYQGLTEEFKTKSEFGGYQPLNDQQTGTDETRV